jgi:hypothetical protein
LSLGRFDLGPEIGYRIAMSNGIVVEPHISVKGIWDFNRPDANAVGGLVVTGDEFHARVQGGVLMRGASGLSMRAVVAYDGIGGNRFRQTGGQVWLNLPLP